jgi:hypothetical protein
MFRFQDTMYLYYLITIPVLTALAILAFKVQGEKLKDCSSQKFINL